MQKCQILSMFAALALLANGAYAQSGTDTPPTAAADAASTRGTTDKNAPGDAQPTAPTSGKASVEKTAPSESQPLPAKKPASSTAIVFNPVGLIFGLYNVDVGVGIAEQLSANFGGSYWSFDILGVKNSAWGLSVGGQYFFYGKRFDGAFVYPALEYARSTVSIGDVSASGSLFGPSAIVGYQWECKPFTLRLGGGIRYYLGNVTGDGLSSDLHGAALKLDGSIGFTL